MEVSIMGTQARYVNLSLGAWLIVSAFLWPHNDWQFAIAWIIGLLLMTVSAVALVFPVVRYLNLPLSAWLFLSAFSIPITTPPVGWTSFLVAIGIFVVTFIPSRPLDLRHVRGWIVSSH
jgi:hypothetical protein